MKKTVVLIFMAITIFSCKSVRKPTELKKVGSRGWHTTAAPVAEFDPRHKSVEIWTPKQVKNPPIVIYAHGGAGFREDDRARIAMLQRHGFATISFDSYEMNGLDWNFVTRRVTNNGKQNLIWGVFEGALKYALKENRKWDVNNIFLYGASNGGRTVLYAGGEFPLKNIRGIISEAPAATGYALGDLNIRAIILFGAMDNWAGKSDTDYVWTRTYPNSPISLEDWLKSQQEKSHPIKFIFYENAGHLLFEGPLEKVTVKRGDKIAFTAYQGADEQVLKLYERDLIEFINTNITSKK